jgi:hypothetical protein
MRPIEKSRKFNVLPEIGAVVKVKAKIASPDSCRAFFVVEKHIIARKAGALGQYAGWVPGAGGDVWWVRHDDGSVGAYMYNELTDKR